MAKRRYGPNGDEARKKVKAKSFKEALRIDALQKMYQDPKPVTLPKLKFMERKLDGI